MSETEIEHHQVAVGGINLHVAAAGPKDGRLLIFLHGFPEFWYGWKLQLAYFAAKGYRVLAPDQRGYNLSDKPAGVASYGLDRLADDVIALMRWAGREKASVVGHDWGAMVAWCLAIRDPEHVEKLGIVNVPHPLVMRRNLYTNPRQILRSWYIFFLQLPWLPELGLRLSQYKILNRSLRGSSNPRTFSKEDLREFQAAWERPGALRGSVNWYRAALRYPPRIPAGGVRVKPKTLILWGVNDRFLGRKLAEQSATFCEQGRLELINDATHWVVHEKPELVNDLLDRFLAN